MVRVTACVEGSLGPRHDPDVSKIGRTSTPPPGAGQSLPMANA
jgi:hypothetical protein